MTGPTQNFHPRVKYFFRNFEIIRKAAINKFIGGKAGIMPRN
jgi:hypothetical protein